MTHEVMDRLIHRYPTHFQHEMSEDEFIEEADDMVSRYSFSIKSCLWQDDKWPG